MSSGRWSTPADVRAAVQREWRSGRLLAGRVPVSARPATAPVPVATVFPFRVRLRGPTSADLAPRFDEVRRWASSFDSPRAFRVEYAERASRTLGRQRLPVAALFETSHDALAFVGRTSQAAAFDDLLQRTPVEFRWYAAAHSLTVLDIGSDWTAVLAVAAWLKQHPNPDVLVRQVDLPGVHTKVVERHRRAIADLVDDGAPRAPVGTLGAFERAYGFRSRPARVRFRALDPSHAPVPGLVDVTLPVDEMAALRPTVERVVVVENEVTMLAFPAMDRGLVVWGAGNQAPELLGDIGWLHDVDVHYWGDLDTHGFAILDRLRAVLPHVRSLLMDRDTLLTHRDRWSREAEPTRRDLPHLTDAEAEVYDELCSNAWGDGVRLEQELVGISAVRDAIERLLTQRGGGR